MAVHKVNGFNAKEQKVFNKFLDGEPHDIRELKRLFWKDAQVRCAATYNAGWGDHEVNGQAQSYVRNSIRRLIRDGWVEQCARGTYKLTRAGKTRVQKGVDHTESIKKKKGGSKKKSESKPKKETKAKKTKSKATKKTRTKATKAKATKSKKAKTTKAKATKAKATKSNSNGSSRPRKTSADKLKKIKRKTKIAAAKEKLSAQAEA
jgi:hypothetical protein